MINVSLHADVNYADTVEASRYLRRWRLQPADYRPISITPVLSRMTDRIVVQRYIYPVASPYTAVQ